MRTRPKLLLVTAAVAVSIGLLAATNALAATTNVAQSADANGEPQLGRVTAPPAPAGCRADQLAARARQVSLLDAEKANEQRVIATIFDGSAPDKLGAIRDRARIVLGRIATIDSQCAGTPAAAPGTPAAPAAPVNANRVLTPVKIVCADVDFTGVDPARAARATGELARNLDELNGRLTSEFPRFAARVAREANPDAPRNEFATLARQQANTLQARRVAILDRAAAGLAARFARTCVVVNA